MRELNVQNIIDEKFKKISNLPIQEQIDELKISIEKFKRMLDKINSAGKSPVLIIQNIKTIMDAYKKQYEKLSSIPSGPTESIDGKRKKSKKKSRKTKKTSKKYKKKSKKSKKRSKKLY